MKFGIWYTCTGRSLARRQKISVPQGCGIYAVGEEGNVIINQEWRDGILEHQFNKRLESFAPCYSQSLLLVDFEENRTLCWH